MTDIVDAIRALDPNAWVGCSNNDINQIHWHDGNPKKLKTELLKQHSVKLKAFDNL